MIVDPRLLLVRQVLHRHLEVLLRTQFLHTKASREVLLACGEARLLVGQCRLHGIVCRHTACLELHRLIVNRSLLLVGQVSQGRLKTSLSTELLLLERCLEVLLTCGHTRCAVTLELLLRTFIRCLPTLGVNITKLLAEVAFAFQPSKKLARPTIGALTCGTKVLDNL